MGLFGSNKDDTKAKIEELKAKMQSGQQGQAQQQQPWQQQPQNPPEGWQPPRQQQQTQQQQPHKQPEPIQQAAEPKPVTVSESHSSQHEGGILLELGEGMSLNLPIKEKMDLDEFLRIADRVRELKKIDRT